MNNVRKLLGFSRVRVRVPSGTENNTELDRQTDIQKDARLGKTCFVMDTEHYAPVLEMSRSRRLLGYLTVIRRMPIGAKGDVKLNFGIPPQQVRYPLWVRPLDKCSTVLRHLANE